MREDLKSRLCAVEERVSTIEEEKSNIEYMIGSLESTVESYKEQEKALYNEYLTLDRVFQLFKQLSDERTEDAVEVIQSTLNMALQSIRLERDYIVDIVLDGMELSFNLIDTKTQEIDSLRHDTGTAVSQILSVLTILVILKLSHASKILFLDETLYGINDRESIQMMAEVLVALAENEDFQIFWVEHKAPIGNVEGIKTVAIELQEDEEGRGVTRRVS